MSTFIVQDFFSHKGLNSFLTDSAHCTAKFDIFEYVLTVEDYNKGEQKP